MNKNFSAWLKKMGVTQIAFYNFVKAKKSLKTNSDFHKQVEKYIKSLCLDPRGDWDDGPSELVETCSQFDDYMEEFVEDEDGAYQLQSSTCCGVREISMNGGSTPELLTLHAIIENWKYLKHYSINPTDIKNFKAIGWTETGTFVNPNTDHTVTVLEMNVGDL